MKQTIFITGVGKRIGYALAKDFLAKGMKVIGTFRTHYPSIDELAELGADLYQCDLCIPAEIEDMLARINDTHDELHCIIHNASDWHNDKTKPGMTSADIMNRMMNIHVSAPYQINLALADKLIASASGNIGSANIIHITDYVAEKGSKKHIAYAASKAAMHNLTLSFASKLAPMVKVNSIAPAMILFNEGDDEAYKAKALAKAILPKEAGNPEIIELVDYLTSSQYVTGRSFAVDGGRHLA
ncbi:dihydromonapterin reductase [Shewanella sp. 5_MG-2023]|uniref:dihydromonapterin reductase n=1 Tax=Shewanella sp. 5_MG-2023 TaxID=3062656 RepID=UPI0026E186FB|nr:dihydromonapterin reductase [Shewanella sp. 5_MG-2023]MDO6638696.1 dihydromonapterin reductase [Shewanella sp. 5_MG-2023]